MQLVARSSKKFAQVWRSMNWGYYLLDGGKASKYSTILQKKSLDYLTNT